MILLDTSTSLKIVLDSTPSTELDWVSVYLDTTDNVPHHSDGKTNGTTDVTLVSSPSSDNRLVRYINVYNNNSSQVKATIKIDDGTNERILVNSTIDSEITLVYDSYAGWYLISATAHPSISDGGVEVVSSVSDINFGTNLSVTDDGDNTVTITSSTEEHDNTKHTETYLTETEVKSIAKKQAIIFG